MLEVDTFKRIFLNDKKKKKKKKMLEVGLKFHWILFLRV